MGAYFPDFAMRVSTTSINLNGINDSAIVYVSVPAVKLYTDTSLFSAYVSNPPSVGNFTFSFLNKTLNTTQNSLLVYPDSLRLKIKATGGIAAGAYTIKVLGNGPNGTPVHERTITVNIGLVGVPNITGTVNNFTLEQNYPNPFNPSTTIEFYLPKNGIVTMKLYDASGRLIKNIMNNINYYAGNQKILFTDKNLSSGIYFYSLYFNGELIDTKKMLLLR
jgi:hypothetical protein